MRVISGLLAAMILAPLPANALLIKPDSSLLVESGGETSQADIDTEIESILGDSSLLYKSNVDDGKEEGPLQEAYATSYSMEPDDPQEALIEWDGDAYISDPTHLLVKDGNSDIAWYLFRITAWNGTDDIKLKEFWPDEGAISHVTIYGGDSEREVPEPTALSLLGVGLLIFGYGTRRRRLS